MADVNVQEQLDAAAPELVAAPLPDYLISPDAVSKDENVQWRFGKAPNYSNTRKVWAETKKANHEPGSLAEMVENLVKNWEVEASFKTRIQDWRTIDHDNYTFAMNGEAPQTAEHMLKVGTYNAIIQSNEYYCPKNSDFASSHKTFKRMMPIFAWEVIEVYSGLPKVSFKWRHWGVMKHDYVGFNDKDEKVTIRAHGGPIEIFGVTAAQVDDKVRLQGVDTYMDPLVMFRQMAPSGVANKEVKDQKSYLIDRQDSGPEVNAVAPEEPKIDRKEDPNRTAVPGSNPGVTTQIITAVGETSSLGACPFGLHQLNNPHPVSQQRLANPVENSNVSASIQNDGVDFTHRSENVNLLPEKRKFPAPTIESISSTRAQEDAHKNENELDEIALDTVSSSSLPTTHHQAISDMHAPANPGPVMLPSTAVNNWEMQYGDDIHGPVKKRKIGDIHEILDSDISMQEATRQAPEDAEGTEEYASVGEAVAARPGSEETRKAHTEMSHISASESLELMNQE